MKFYNPFKPHFCEFGDGTFGMRKLSIFFGWVYLDTSDMHFWQGSNYSGSRHQSLGSAKAVIAKNKAAIQKELLNKKSKRVQ